MKANDFRFSGYSEKDMGKFILSLNHLLSPRKLVLSNDLEYEFENELRNIYTEKQKQFGMDSLFILVDKRKEPWAIYQNRKLYAHNKDKTKYSTVAAMLSHAESYHKPFTWLIIKNPVIESFGHREKKLNNPHYEREQNIGRQVGITTRNIKYTLRRLKDAAKDTLLEYDNFYFLAERFAKQILNGADEEEILKKYYDTDPDIGETGFEYNFKNLVRYFKDRLNVKNRSETDTARVNNVRDYTAKFIAENKGIPYEQSAMPSNSRSKKQAPLRDVSGYKIDLTRFVVKRAENFKNSENAIVEMVKDLEKEFNDFVKLATEKINEAINTSEWKLVQPWARSVTSLQPDIKKLVENELPAKDDDMYGYRRHEYVSKIAEALRDLRSERKDLLNPRSSKYW